ncbi:hypothetical protein [Rhizobium phage RHEph15]|uniref:Uncharacterized protein n=1 Tax=Rhizobium phage RHph_TM34 TaxID=2509556 RepID=A0A7S5UQC5_9CAUD|nr:hypothetical protein EVB35_020 [Rhizobium phage RHph_TM34]QXV74281.1 hypothetical protein [Rhizobium phage RHEph15]QXV74975.1 hypothetical protein [Rhizobium phage RHEph27]
MVQKLNNSELTLLLRFTPHLIGGSYVVNPDAANDIDVLIHEYLHTGELQTHLLSKGFHTMRSDDERYDTIDNARLMAVYEGKIGDDKCNILVVGATFWPAYQGAIAAMRNDPELYTTRDERIELHRSLARQVADIAQVELPEG